MDDGEGNENDCDEWVNVEVEWVVELLVQLVGPKMSDEKDLLMHWVVKCKVLRGGTGIGKSGGTWLSN